MLIGTRRSQSLLTSVARFRSSKRGFLRSIRINMCKRNRNILTGLSLIHQRGVFLAVLLTALIVCVTPAVAQARTTSQLKTTHPASLVTSTFQGEDLGGVWRGP